MASYDDFLETVDDIIETGKKHEILHLSTTGEVSGNQIELRGKQVTSFSSCSYLGLEFDDRLAQGAMEAIQKYGTQFSCSRSYISLGLYKELEGLFNQIFDAHCIVTSTTTLGHVSAIPVLVGDNDAVIYDHQVHHSVHVGISLLKQRKVHVEPLRHNKMDDLEKRIIQLQDKYDKVWYMADGIYSMFGDACPIKEVEALLNKYEAFNVYIDDAHGMSWCGENGKGYILSQIDLHERLVLAVSLNKAFAAGGGLLIFPTKESKKKVYNYGGPLSFSGPLQPASLGAAVASAKIHLSLDIEQYQKELKDNIDYANNLISGLNLPCVSLGYSPVFFIGVSLKEIAYVVIQRLLDKGHFVNLGIFPAVSLRNTGIRFVITRLHTKEQIKSLLIDMKEILDDVIEEKGFSYDKIYKAFRRVMEPVLT